MKIFQCFFIFIIAIPLYAADFYFPTLSLSSTQEEWLRFAIKGGGYFPIPEHLKPYLSATKDFAKKIGHTHKEKKEYFSEGNMQLEFLMIEKSEWEEKYPKDTVLLAQGMNDVGIAILQNTLIALGIDKTLHQEITGGLINSGGTHYFKVAHYDSLKSGPGIVPHKDVRWITVLYFDEAGLEGYSGNGQFIDVKTREGHFFINIGVYLEAFINDIKRCQALVHRVPSLSKDRTSFGVFLEGKYDSGLFPQLVKNDVREDKRIYRWVFQKEIKKYLVKDGGFTTTPHQIDQNILDQKNL